VLNPTTLIHPLLTGLAEDLKPLRYLEIGVREGCSLERVLEGAGSFLHYLYLADTWGGDYGGTGRGNHAHIEEMLKGRGFRMGRVTFLDGDSKVTIPPLQAALTEQIQLALVDGDHSEAGANADLENAWPLIAPGGVLVFDDVCHPAHQYLWRVFKRFVEKYREEVTFSLSITVHPYGAGVVWKRPKKYALKRTSQSASATFRTSRRTSGPTLLGSAVGRTRGKLRSS
jgi:hypothetical protein